jgi:integrase
MVLSERIKEINKRSENPKKSQPSRSVTMEGLVSGLWQSYVANKNYKPSTAYGYQSLLNAHIIPGLGKKILTQIRPEDLSFFFDSVREREVSNKTLLNLYNLVDLLFDLAVQFDWIQSSPVRPRLHRTDYRRVKKQALTPKQIAEVLEHVPPDHFPLFATIALTGLRLGEALAPRWLDVDFSECTLSVTHSLWRGQLVPPKTDESEQTIQLSEELAKILLQHRHRSKWTAPGDFVFSREDGSPWDPDHLRKMVLRPALDAAGIKRE